nr:HNH endonuclease [Longibacter salinarum]
MQRYATATRPDAVPPSFESSSYEVGRGSPRMTGHVLVLNQDYSALTVCSVQRAVILMHLQKVHLVEAVPDQYIRSPNLRYPSPSIVRLKQYASVPYKRVMLSRKNIIKRDRSTCQYCGSRDDLTIDHVLPKSRGGRDTWENLVTACVSCNNAKGDRTPEEVGMELDRDPFRPSYVMFIRDFVGSVDDTWKPYLFLS